LLQAPPFQAHWGRWHCTRFLRPACLFTAHVGSGSFPRSCGVFLPLPLLQAFPLLIAGGSSPLLPGLFYLFTVLGGIPLPSSSALRAPHPLCYMSLLFLLLITQFLFFSGWGSVCPGGLADLSQGCLWNYWVPLSSPCLCLPKPSGFGHLVAWGPSWFLCLTWGGDALRRLEMWRGKSFASSQWPCLQGVSPVSLQDFTIGGSLSASFL
jgi:hypothetical protein